MLVFTGTAGTLAADAQTSPKVAEWESLQPVASFRVTFGLKDRSPTAWDGQILPEEKQRLQVEEDRFRNHDYMGLGSGPGRNPELIPPFPNDRLTGETSWICSTRAAPVRAQAGGIAPIPIIQQPSILIHLRNNAFELPVHVKTVAGEFSFSPRDIVASRSLGFRK